MSAARPSLDAALAAAAVAPRLLVATDFDGTLTPFAPRPWMVTPDAGALAALGALAAVAATQVAVVSARTLADLTEQMGAVAGVQLLGSYGAETAAGPVGLDEAEARRWARLAVTFERLAVVHEAAWVERKALGVALHARGVGDSSALLARAVEAAAAMRDVHVVRGNEVVEAMVRPTSKAWAVDALAVRWLADVTVYLGDDHADEEVFARLGPADVGLHVGPGPTAAGWTVADPAEAGRALTRLAALRRTAADRSYVNPREDLDHAR